MELLNRRHTILHPYNHSDHTTYELRYGYVIKRISNIFTSVRSICHTSNRSQMYIAIVLVQRDRFTSVREDTLI